MKNVCLFSLTLLLSVTSHAAAVDLSQVSRTIGDEPEYRTQPKYALLVFGPGAATRVWLVHDGDTLYADLNGDGDLTDPAERIAAHEDSDADDGNYHFEVGEIREVDLLHKSLSVGTMNLRHLVETDPRVKQALLDDPQARFYRLGIDLQMPARRGAGIGGRVEHLVGPLDSRGLLRFADTPKEAPIIHLGGLWEITLYSGAKLTIGRQTEVILSLGTPGLGPGTTAFAAYQDLVPAGTYPKLHVTLPGDDKPLEYVLRERCCYVNFHGGVRLADDAPTGEATVKITFDDWLGGYAAPTTHKVQIVQPKFDFALEPVSPRLKGSLIHSSRDARNGQILGIRYSPDGKRIIAGDYPGGVIQHWDVETRAPLATIETEFGYGNPYEYFHVTPQWQVVFTPRRKSEHRRVERDGKVQNLWTFHGEIGCWDPVADELQWQLQDSPRRRIRHMNLSPNGKYIASSEELPGEFSGRPDQRLSLWNTHTQTRREFSNLSTYSTSIFSADSSRFAACRWSEDSYVTSVEVFDVETAERRLSIPIADQRTRVSPMNFTPDGAVLIGTVMISPDRKEYSKSMKTSLKFWNTDTGEEVGSIQAGHIGERFFGQGTLSPDGRAYAVEHWGDKRLELNLIDVAHRKISKTVELGGKEITLLALLFNPDGRWLAAATQHFPESWTFHKDSTLDLPQPRIHLIEVATGEIRETIVCPQTFMASLCFSPDGQTLATSGPGRVLLWDLSTPPGELPKR